MTLHHGDCLEVMAAMEPESVDAIVTDPPYGLEFMGKEWDKLTAVPKRDDRWSANWGGYGWHGGKPIPGLQQQEFHARWAEAAYRVAKPSAYLLAFGGTRTVHRMTVALEDAGWIIRDMLVWGYASGFPKSKASLKPAWEPIVMARKPGPLRMLNIDECRIGTEPRPLVVRDGKDTGGVFGERGEALNGSAQIGETTSGRWPANVVLTDPIFDGGVEGVVGGGIASPGTAAGVKGSSGFANGYDGEYTVPYGDSGTYSRFFQLPTRYNETCQECGHVSTAGRPSSPLNRSVGSAPSPVPIGAFDEFTTGTDSPRTSGTATPSLSDDAANMPSILRSRRRATSPESGPKSSPARFRGATGQGIGITTTTLARSTCGTCAEATTFGITRPSPGARSYPFAFLIPKAARTDREPVLGGLPERAMSYSGATDPDVIDRAGDGRNGLNRIKQRANVHPTVKPTDLMRHLVRLVTPPGGTVLDPFLGSGTTALAAEMEGFDWIGIEREAEYVAIAEARLNGTQRGLGLGA